MAEKEKNKALTVRLDEETHTELKVKLAREGRSFQSWCEEKIKEFIQE